MWHVWLFRLLNVDCLKFIILAGGRGNYCSPVGQFKFCARHLRRLSICALLSPHSNYTLHVRCHPPPSHSTRLTATLGTWYARGMRDGQGGKVGETREGGREEVPGTHRHFIHAFLLSIVRRDRFCLGSDSPSLFHPHFPIKLQF